MPRGITVRLVRQQDSEVKVRLAVCFVLRCQVAHKMLPVAPQVRRTVFYLLERVNGGDKGPALVYIASAPAFSQAPDFDAVVATGTTRLQTLRRFQKEVKARRLNKMSC